MELSHCVEPLPYGPNTDFLKNVVEAGSATIVHDGNTTSPTGPRSFPCPPRHLSSRQRTNARTACSASTVDQHWGEPLDPAVDGDVVEVDPAFGEEFVDVR